MKFAKLTILLSIFIFFSHQETKAQTHSVAREWNELLLESIRNDYARPTVHARNLYHASIAMYDIWAVFDSTAVPFFLGQTVDGYNVQFNGFTPLGNFNSGQAAIERAMSYAMYRLLSHRFANSPNAAYLQSQYDAYMTSKGYMLNNNSTNYNFGSAVALGNYVGQQLINFGLQDESNEVNGYVNTSYTPVNDPMVMQTNFSGNPDITDLNRWQPLSFSVFIDQSGNVTGGTTPDFLSPEWGSVSPFALSTDDLTINTRNGFDYWVYHDPGMPPQIDVNTGAMSEEYQWGFALVSAWSSHLDANDPTLWDISPASIGNVQNYPTDFAGMQQFYDLENGGDPGTGHNINPKTGLPYTPQMVKRADYARVLAEFWADGPDSETPPGHWFTILNYVNDHPEFEKRFEGVSAVMDDLEWDVKAYFCLAGALHDAAVAVWGIKGWYDYIRPVSAIRAMAEYGQSSDPSLPSYHIAGLPLIPGLIELVEPGDPFGSAHIGKVKVYAWRGPSYINNPATDEAGVGWILAENWWPYQRPSFVTPNFAGYVSGHSTFSRAAAEVMTALTGDAFFPGGMGEFNADQNQFLVFEEGPSTDIVLQWATYRDASDQCSLSRIWGGIHPPADDIPGRFIGMEIGVNAFELAKSYIYGFECPSYYEIVNDSLISSYYHAKDSIYSNCLLRNNTTVDFKAGKCIDLDNGFEVKVGSEFSAEIEVCP